MLYFIIQEILYRKIEKIRLMKRITGVRKTILGFATAKEQFRTAVAINNEQEVSKL